MVTTTFILVVCLVSPVIFAATVWLTRASTKRATAALAGGVLAALLDIGWDTLADRMDWWDYSFRGDAAAQLALYIPVAFVFGGAAGLIGWRMMRAMGAWTGGATFFAAYVGLGVLRDHVLASQSDMFSFGEGGAPHLFDAVCYAMLALALLLTMLAMAGAPRSDAMRPAA